MPLNQLEFAAQRPDRISEIVQRVMFAPPIATGPEDLYLSVEVGAAERTRRKIRLAPGTRVSTNTYFGRFPASYYQRWTGVRDLAVRMRAWGRGQLAVCASDDVGHPRTLGVMVVDSPTPSQLTFPVRLDRFMDGGAIWVEASGDESDLAVEDVEWVASPAVKVRPTAIVICTFNRADDCIRTLSALAGDADAMSLVSTVYVVDQGTDTVESRGAFDELVTLLAQKLHYIRQPNLGGAGGFSRGLYEITDVEHKGHANVLFMDDDIVLEPETVVRLTAFANRSATPVLVGAQMLNLFHPNRLHVAAETLDLGKLKPAVPVDRRMTNVDLTERLPEAWLHAGYTAWWSCLVPAEAVQHTGFPLPVFFQWDDIEYGLRAREHGFPTVTLPGAAVWHADFAWKDWDDWARYFSIRNSMIAAALHDEFDPRSLARVLGGQLSEYIVSMRYGLAATVLRAIGDFLAGPEILQDGGVEAAASIRKLRAEFPETVRVEPTDLDVSQLGHAPFARDLGTPSLPRAVMIKRFVYQMRGKQQPKAIIPASDAQWWHVSLFRQAIVTDAAQDAVRLREFDRDRMLKVGRQSVMTLRRLTREGRNAQVRWKAALPALSSRDNWKRLFESR